MRASACRPWCWRARCSDVPRKRKRKAAAISRRPFSMYREVGVLAERQGFLSSILEENGDVGKAVP